jgi:hypothetical protein
MIVNDESERMWREAIMAYVKKLCQYLPGGTEEIHNLAG